jgi:alpha-L-rhamnosidase
MTLTPHHLRIEHLDGGALGVTVANPRLSWQLPDAAVEQRSYDVRLGDGRTATVESADHVLVPWPFGPVGSRTRLEWQVRVVTDSGSSDWSDPAWFETGLLRADDWTAAWISPQEDDIPPPGERPAHVLRHEFHLDALPVRARLYATAHGFYESFLNGRRVGDAELAPGFTEYASILHVQMVDVADLLGPGHNVWEVVLSDGLYRGKHGNSKTADGFGHTVAFLGQLEMADRRIVTGADWRSSTGAITAADLMAGQREDHRRSPDRWRPVLLAEPDGAALLGSPAPPVRRVQELRPVSVSPHPSGSQIVDLGQNITGWMRLTDLGPRDTRIELVHGEALDHTGDVTTAHLEPSGVPLGQVDVVIAAGTPGETFEPRHTVHGFQYVRVEGHPGGLTPDDATGVVVHSDLRRTGWFRCSDERINQLHEIADWSFRDNACDVPTDCPHRERSGWTGDWQLFIPTAAYLYDVAGFSLKWLRDLAAAQQPDGLLPNYVPDHRRRRAVAEADLRWYGLLGSSGWGDACAIVPWEMYRAYGDTDVLAEMWPTILGWLRYAANAARTRRHQARAAARPEPQPHEQFLWDGGWHWGEWHEPVDQVEPFWLADQGSVGTAYLHHTAALAARIGRLIGRDDDVAALDELAAGALDAWRREYIGADGALIPDSQANHVRALAFGLVPDQLRAQTAARLVELIRATGNHLTTGFLATPMLLPTLADAGHVDVAYDLLFQPTPPSWLAMVDRGATTVWEAWNGIDEHGDAHDSLNHYVKGAVISFLHRYVAGIRLHDDVPAYRRFRIEPHPGGGVTWAESAHDSPYGRIESSWRIDGDRFDLTVTVPPGTSADVRMPDGTAFAVGVGTSHHACTVSR